MAEPTVRFSTDTAGSGSLGARPVAPTVGVEGGGVAPARPVRSGASWFDSSGGMTTELGGNLPEFINAAFAPALENTKNKRMWEGFVAARAGKTMQEIDEEQPWYSRLFGPSNYEIGAQTFTAQKQAADMENDLLQRMPELRTMTPQQWADEMNKVSESAMTGNPYTDTLVRKIFMDRAGPLTDLYTKERSAWENQELLRQQVDAGSSAANALQQLSVRVAELGADHPDAPELAQQLEEAQLVFADTLTPSQFQTDESKFAMYRSVALNAAENGNFYALNFMIDAGLRDALTIEQREQFDADVEARRNHWLANRPIDDEVVRSEAQWKVEAARGIMSAEASLALAHDINRRHMARTGDRKGLIRTSEATATSGTALSAYYSALAAEESARRSAQEAAATDAQKELLRQQAITRNASLWKDGSIGMGVHSGILSKDDAEIAAMAHYQTNPTEALQAAVAAYAFPNFPFVSKRLAEAVQQGINAAPDVDWTPSFHSSYEQFKMMENTRPTSGLDQAEDTTSGPNAARAIFGEENAALFREYEVGLRANMDPQIAYAAAQRKLSRAPIGQGDLNKDQAKALDDVLDGPNAFMRLLTGQPKLVARGVLRSHALREYPKMQRLYPDKDNEWWAKAAVQAAKEQDTDVAGEYSWQRRTDHQPITAYAQEVSPDVYGGALRNYIHKSLKSASIDVDDEDTQVYIHRVGDRDGFPHLMLFASDKNGNIANLSFQRPDFEKVQREALELEGRKMEAANQHLFYGGRDPRRN